MTPFEVPFSLVGQSGGHHSTQFSSELTQNLYIDASDASGKRGIHDFPGFKAWSTCDGADRGHYEMAGALYKLNGTTLYKVDQAGGCTSVGTIAGSDRAVFATDGTYLGIVSGNSIYKCDGSTTTTVTQSVVTSPTWIAWLNSQWLIGDADRQYSVSNVGDIDSWNALNSAYAEQKADSGVRGYIFNNLLYYLCSDHTEIFYNSGVGNPPFDRQETALVNIGCAGKHAVTNTRQYLYWLGNDKKFYRAISGSFQTVSSTGLSNKIEAMTVTSDCVMSSFTYQGQDFVFATFPTENKAFFYSETFDYWNELCSGTDFPSDRSIAGEFFEAYGKLKVSDYRNGNTYDVDPDTYSDAGEARLRVRTLPEFTGSSIRRPGRRITVSKIRLNIQKGVGLATGQGSAPVLMCELSNDGGHTYGSQVFVDMGVMGDYVRAVDFDAFATGYEIKARIKCSDPVFLSMTDGIAFISDAGY